jgi:hypothetical protein
MNTHYTNAAGRQPSAHLQDLMTTMARADAEIERLTGTEGLREKFDAAEASIRNEYAQTAAAPREVEHYPRLPIVNADMSVTQRNAYYAESEFRWYGSMPAFETFVRGVPSRRYETPLALTLAQHHRLMDAIATRTTWIKHPVVPQTPTPEIAWSAHDCRASMFQPTPDASSATFATSPTA